MYDLGVINRIKDELIKFKETIAIGESVTSGHLQAAFSQATLATEFYQGGITTYNLTQKTKLLQIDPVHAMTCNCVSEKVASEMAEGVSRLFKTDWGIAITGYAAPVPALGVEELFAYWAIAYRGETKKVEKIKAEKKDSLEVQLIYTNHVLEGFLEIVRGVRL